MNRYVCGFLLECVGSGFADRVLLTRKKFPEWQAGYLNGVGGKIEPGENPTEAMRRESAEEIGLATADWRQFAAERHPEYEVHFFRARRPDGFVAPTRNDVGEEITWTTLPLSAHARPVGNLRWLLPLALDWRNLGLVQVHTMDSIAERPTW